MNRSIGTVESVINNKQALHNGDMGVYVDENFTLIEPDEVEGLEKKVEDLYKYLSLITKYKVNKRTFGVEVEAYGGKEKAFIGYDESIDSTYRLCYTTNTFLSMDILRKMINYGSPKKKSVKEQEEVEKVTVISEVKESSKKEDGEDYGWGTLGQAKVNERIEQNINRACNVFRQVDVTKTKPSQVENFRNKALKLIKDSQGELTVGREFKQGTKMYKMFKNMLEGIATFIPHTEIKEQENGLTWDLPNGDNILTVMDKELGKRNEQTGALIVVPKNTPIYTIVNKLFAFVSSSVGYNKLTKQAKEMVKEDSNKPKVVNNKEKEVNRKPKEVKKEQEVKQENYLTEKDYFDIYLPQANKWGKEDSKYKEVKETIKEVVDSDNVVDGVSILGIGTAEVVVDWVIDKETYTMALTEKATRVKELEVKYDMAIAYDTKHPELLKVLILNKLEPLIEQ